MPSRTMNFIPNAARATMPLMMRTKTRAARSPRGADMPRDIPTWKEVIGQIIAGNMESRAARQKAAEGARIAAGAVEVSGGRGGDSGGRARE